MPRFAALDTKFLLALAGGESDAEATIDYLAQKGFTPIATESVMEQLGELQENGDDQTKQLAGYAATWMITWGVITPSCPHAANGTAQINAARLIEQGLIDQATIIEAEILCEAACAGCEILITYSEALLDAPTTPLNLALVENDLNKVIVIIASPSLIAQRLEVLNAEQRAVTHN